MSGDGANGYSIGRRRRSGTGVVDGGGGADEEEEDGGGDDDDDILPVVEGCRGYGEEVTEIRLSW